MVVFALALQAPLVTTLARGQSSGVSQARQALVRDRVEWEALWKVHAPTEATPTVDFSSREVAAVFLGTRPTGGYSVDIVGTRFEAQTLIVEYAERRPGRSDILAQVITAPFHIVSLAKHDGPVRFESRTANGQR
jgi:protease stability complex PrcB-like protein